MSVQAAEECKPAVKPLTTGIDVEIIEEGGSAEFAAEFSISNFYVREDGTPYTIKVLRNDLPVFEAPGYDYSCSATIWNSGTYTVIQEEEDGSWESAEELYTLSELNPGTAFVAGVEFYGDMTAYGISFTDAAGDGRSFAAHISVRNGSLLLDEYK